MTVIFIRLECQFVIISTLLAHSNFPEFFYKEQSKQSEDCKSVQTRQDMCLL